MTAAATLRSAIVLFLALLLNGGVSAGAEAIPDHLLNQGLRYRLVGPFRGGRANTVSGIPGDPTTYYFGAAGGGVWKTTDGGVTWFPIFDDQPIGAIGSLAVAPSDSNVIYVGTGDPKMRNNLSHGDGVYKSTDAGRTWVNLGLVESRHIGRVIVHPKDPNVVFVAALGRVFGENEERGIFRSTDGGANWEKVLYVDGKTGGVDVAFDPANPRILFAAMWQVLRTPYSLVSGGTGSGLYRSDDSGSTWTRLEGNGLPGGILGKIGVVVSPADSSRVYAVIEAEEGGLYRSDDGGGSWELVNTSHHLTERAWYFMQVIADPEDKDLVYVLSINFMKSIDGGRRFEIVDQYHVDNQDLWIDPGNPKRMISGNDGGANISLNGGRSWVRTDDNQPTGQFYRVATDDRFPYHLYGGQQDFDIIAIASRGRGGGITRSDWYGVGGCEMGWAAPYPNDPNIVFAGCTDGGLTRYDHRTGATQSVEPWPETFIGHGAIDAKYRFQWTAPMLISPHDPDVLYMGGNVLFRSTDHGKSWTPISEDLTRNDPSKLQASGGPLTRDNVGSEFYCTIFSLDESPREKGVIWAGSDDGLVHLTRDGGGNWTDVTPDAMLEWSNVIRIDASPHEAGVAYLAVERHKLDDYRPYIFKTADYGKTWVSIAEGIPEGAFVRVVREDSVRRGLLYAGTETGIYVSFDDGARWQSLQINLPVSPVYDLEVKGNDLVVATHGRAFWILDDVSPLRELNEEIASSPVHLFKPGVTVRVRDDFTQVKTPAGENPPPGAVIYYALGKAPSDEVAISIVDSRGELVRRFSSQVESDANDPFGKSSPVTEDVGLNRFVWDLRYPGPKLIPGHLLFYHAPLTPAVGPLALPGSYEVRLEAGGRTLTAPLEVRLDPRVNTEMADLQAQFDLHIKIRDTHSELNEAVLGLRDLREELAAIRERALELGGAERVVTEVDRLLAALEEIEYAITEPRMETGGDTFHFPTKLDNKLAILIGVVANSDTAPTEPAYEVYEDLLRRVKAQLEILETMIDTDLPALNRLAEENGIPAAAAIVRERLGRRP